MAAGSIRIIDRIPWEELEPLIREVPLLGRSERGATIYPYRTARLSLRRVHPNELCASTKYLISKNIQRQHQLMNSLVEASVDIFNLNCALDIENELGERWRLMPPVVEVVQQEVCYVPRVEEINYSSQPKVVPLNIITDGMHRTYIARELNRELTVIHISGVDNAIPYYALPNGWDEIRTYDDTPQTKEEKKLYRREDCYSLYRNFDVLGCGKPRYVGNGEILK